MNGVKSTTVLASAVAALLCGTASATEPCGDFGECKVLVEINSSDGDVGFHFLMDGSDLRYGALFNPKHRKIYAYGARRELARQFVTETFNESAEPLCWHPEPDDDEYGEPVVTLEEFIDRWMDGTYYFFGIGAGWETSFGQSELTFNLPRRTRLNGRRKRMAMMSRVRFPGSPAAISVNVLTKKILSNSWPKACCPWIRPTSRVLRGKLCSSLISKTAIRWQA